MAERNFLQISDLSSDDYRSLFAVTSKLKLAAKNPANARRWLDGRSVAMIFEKPSNRTRVSFEVGIFQLGGHSVMLRSGELQMGSRESVKDVASVLSRYVDAVVMRVLKHESLEEFARYSSVPVLNALSDASHPCQALSDFFTVIERKGSLDGLKFCYVGDGNNVCRSLVELSSLFAVDFVVSSPGGYELDMASSEANFSLESDVRRAVDGADVIYTDVWCSMGQESERDKRLRDFNGYTVDAQLLKRAKVDVMFMHCLPGKWGEEASSEVAYSDNSVIFDQAENRLHAQKAILLYLLNPEAFRSLC